MLKTWFGNGILHFHHILKKFFRWKSNKNWWNQHLPLNIFPVFCKRFAVLWFHLFLLPFAFHLVSNQGLSVLIWLEFFHTFLQKLALSLKNHHSQKWTQNWRESKKTTKNGNFWSLYCSYRRKLRANFVYKKKTHTLNKQTNYKSTIIFSLYRTMLSDGCLRTERTEYTPPWKWFLPSVLRILRMYTYTYTHSRAHTQTMKLSLFATSIYGKLIKANANMDDVNMRVLSLIVYAVRVAACLLAWVKLLPSSGWTCDNMLAVAFVAFCVW